tara:strand:- start:638 stop:1378 length:741 start_codon:yes stop_codon:yes gene_type:complete
MLVSLATNQLLSAGSVTTFTYSPTSFQKAFVKVDDAANDAWSTYLTIQLGSRTIVNDIPFGALLGYQELYSAYIQLVTDQFFAIDCGSWQLLNNENLYIQIRTTNEQTAVDVSAVVDEASLNPVQYTIYEDNVFTSENVLCAIGSSLIGSNVDEDVTNVTIRNQIMSSSPTVTSGNSYWRSMRVSTAGLASSFSLLYKESVPHTTSFNYSSGATMEQITIAQSIPYTRDMLSQAKNRAFLDQAFAS